MIQPTPEVFTLVGINLFLTLSLVTHLLGNHFPKTSPYIYQAVALLGLGLLVVSRVYLAQVETVARFWCSFVYLIGALTNVFAANFYVAAVKKLWTAAKAWAGAFTCPSIAVVMFFAFQYGSMQGNIFLLAPQIGLIAVALFIGIGLTATLNSETAKMLRRGREVKQ